MSLLRRATVAIVGGGVVGASVAYHLAARGQRDVLILDRGPPPMRGARAGPGSTGRATGGFRAQFGTALNVRLSLLARDKLRRFAQEIGADPGYDPVGYLWLANHARELALMQAALAVQHAADLVEATEVSPDDVARLNPAVRLDGIVGGAYCPSDGFIRPLDILQGYLAAAARLGVEVAWETEVERLTTRANRVTAVHTTGGSVAVDAVVNAAGPWASLVARMAGVPLPVTPLRRQVAATVPCDRLPAKMPMTIWAGDGFHLRVRDGRVLLLRPTPGVPGRPFDATLDPAWIESVVTTAGERLPVLRGVEVDAGASWAGLYEVSPDKHAILGRAPGCENLYLVNGSSGHGVMHAPALGQLLAEIMLDGEASTLDVRGLRPARFDEGEPNEVSELL